MKRYCRQEICGRRSRGTVTSVSSKAVAVTCRGLSDAAVNVWLDVSVIL
jgi:hypothetical protein